MRVHLFIYLFCLFIAFSMTQSKASHRKHPISYCCKSKAILDFRWRPLTPLNIGLFCRALLQKRPIILSAREYDPQKSRILRARGLLTRQSIRKQHPGIYFCKSKAILHFHFWEITSLLGLLNCNRQNRQDRACRIELADVSLKSLLVQFLEKNFYD